MMKVKCESCGMPAQVTEKKIVAFLPFKKKVSNLKNLQGKELCVNCYDMASKMKTPMKPAAPTPKVS